MLSDTDEVPEAELDSLRSLATHVDGVVLCSPRMDDAELVEASQIPTPLVMTARMVPGIAIATVTVDSHRDCSELLGQLHQLGHRRIVYVAGPERSWQNQERLRAVLDSAAFGMQPHVVPGGSSIVGGLDATASALEFEPTAIVAFNDVLALGIYEGLRDRDIEIGSEVSVASFDDISYAAHVVPSLTTVRSRRAEMGRMAFDLLLALIRDEPVSPSQMAPSEIAWRASTGPVHSVV